MRKNANPKKSFRFLDAIVFFILIALVIQIAVLVYDFIITKTDDKVLIALLILIVIIILSVICTIADYFRRKYKITHPTQKILDTTSKIANGNFNAKCKILHAPNKYDEFDYIMQNVNLMSEELKKTEVLKTDFISNVSHEIKTPLSVIQSYAFALQDTSLDETTKDKYAKTLLVATKKLSALITNILKLNKLENQSITADYVDFDLSGHLSECIIGLEELIESKSLCLDCDLDDIYIHSSPSLLEIVWNNLLSNAIKFTDPNGKITITLKRENDLAVASFKDTGCGISAEKGQRIFDKFYQADDSHSQEGNGLGLALVKKVIDILGGEISVDSAVGVGTTFTIKLSGVINER